jgi:hypothetical protein
MREEVECGSWVSMVQDRKSARRTECKKERGPKQRTTAGMGHLP